MWMQVVLRMAHLKSLSVVLPADEGLGLEGLSLCFGSVGVLETSNNNTPQWPLHLCCCYM